MLPPSSVTKGQHLLHFMLGFVKTIRVLFRQYPIFFEKAVDDGRRGFHQSKKFSRYNLMVDPAAICRIPIVKPTAYPLKYALNWTVERHLQIRSPYPSYSNFLSSDSLRRIPEERGRNIVLETNHFLDRYFCYFYLRFFCPLWLWAYPNLRNGCQLA